MSITSHSYADFYVIPVVKEVPVGITDLPKVYDGNDSLLGTFLGLTDGPSDKGGYGYLSIITPNGFSYILDTDNGTSHTNINNTNNQSYRVKNVSPLYYLTANCTGDTYLLTSDIPLNAIFYVYNSNLYYGTAGLYYSSSTYAPLEPLSLRDEYGSCYIVATGSADYTAVYRNDINITGVPNDPVPLPINIGQ